MKILFNEEVFDREVSLEELLKAIALSVGGIYKPGHLTLRANAFPETAHLTQKKSGSGWGNGEMEPALIYIPVTDVKEIFNLTK